MRLVKCLNCGKVLAVECLDLLAGHQYPAPRDHEAWFLCRACRDNPSTHTATVRDHLRMESDEAQQATKRRRSASEAMAPRQKAKLI